MCKFCNAILHFNLLMSSASTLFHMLSQSFPGPKMYLIKVMHLTPFHHFWFPSIPSYGVPQQWRGMNLNYLERCWSLQMRKSKIQDNLWLYSSHLSEWLMGQWVVGVIFLSGRRRINIQQGGQTNRHIAKMVGCRCAHLCPLMTMHVTLKPAA